LDYGDSSAVTSVRRRRTDSEDADGTNERDAKRMRSSRDESEGTAGKSEKEDVAYKSGSEEGEIEEEWS
jgi:hypothetical protein